MYIKYHTWMNGLKNIHDSWLKKNKPLIRDWEPYPLFHPAPKNTKLGLRNQRIKKLKAIIIGKGIHFWFKFSVGRRNQYFVVGKDVSHLAWGLPQSPYYQLTLLAIFFFFCTMPANKNLWELECGVSLTNMAILVYIACLISISERATVISNLNIERKGQK